MTIDARVAYVADTLGPKLVNAYQKDRLAPKGLSTQDLTRQLSDIDPTNGKNLVWLANRYAHENFRMEDRTRVRKALEDFQRLKPKLPIRDINRYSSLSHLESATTISPPSGSKRQERLKLKREGAEIFYQASDCTIIKLLTKEAATYYGRGTKWCTAALWENAFDRYNDLGPLYVLIDGATHQKYQIHFATQQFMDEKDEDTSRDMLRRRFAGFKLLERTLLSSKANIISNFNYIDDPVDRFHTAIVFVLEQELFDRWEDLIVYTRHAIRETANLLFFRGSTAISRNLTILNLLNRYIGKLNLEAMRLAEAKRVYEFEAAKSYLSDLYHAVVEEVNAAGITDIQMRDLLLGMTTSVAEIALLNLQSVRIQD